MEADQTEKVKFWRLPELHNLELLYAKYTHQSFAKHMHEGFAIGVIEQGGLRFSYRKKKNIASPGCINLVIPGEAHDGTAVSSEGWAYRMFYLDSALMEQAVYELSGKTGKLPFFAAGVIQDNSMADFIRNFHVRLEKEKEKMPIMEQESMLLAMLTGFITRHATQKVGAKSLASNNRAVTITREFIEDNYMQNISLQELSRLCTLSPFHLLRTFKESVGVPPHIYLKQVRIKRAKAFLAQGFSLSYAAQETGFADQSHFARQFKQITGITPKTYSNIVQ